MSTTSHSLSALTTLTPTPCSPPETLYVVRSNFPPACSVVMASSTPGTPSVGWTSTGIPRPSSDTVTEPSSRRITSISVQ